MELKMMQTNLNYICLECEKEFRNYLKIAICNECLKKEIENYKRGIPSKYTTVNLYIENNLKKK
jgi:hypothetical protein